MWYEMDSQRGNYIKLSVDDVKELLFMNKSGKKPKSLEDFAIEETIKVDESKHEDLVGQVTLQTLEEKERKRRRGHQNRNKNHGRSGTENKPVGEQKVAQDNRNKSGDNKNKGGNNRNKGGDNRNKGRDNRNKGGDNRNSGEKNADK